MKNKLLLLSIIYLVILSSCDDKTPKTPASEIYSNMPKTGYEVRIDSNFILSPKITYDINSEYTWTENGKVISKEKDYPIKPKHLGTYNYMFNLKNDRVNKDFNFIVQALYVSDFDELTLEKDSFWINNSAENNFNSGILDFSIVGKPNYDNVDWFGFTYSNIIDSNNNPTKDYFSSYSNNTEHPIKNFALLKQDSLMSPSYISFSDGKEHLLKSLSVNISLGTYNALMDGTDNSKIFGGDTGNDKDSLVLELTGLNASKTTSKTIDFFLADFRFDNNRKNYVINKWTTIPLDKLGMIKKLKLRIVSSDLTQDNKLITPTTICIDSLKTIR